MWKQWQHSCVIIASKPMAEAAMEMGELQCWHGLGEVVRDTQHLLGSSLFSSVTMEKPQMCKL